MFNCKCLFKVLTVKNPLKVTSGSAEFANKYKPLFNWRENNDK
nr:MAG TPA: hypothetical protein [Caudoviricetes sp.]